MKFAIPSIAKRLGRSIGDYDPRYRTTAPLRGPVCLHSNPPDFGTHDRDTIASRMPANPIGSRHFFVGICIRQTPIRDDDDDDNNGKTDKSKTTCCTRLSP